MSKQNSTVNGQKADSYDVVIIGAGIHGLMSGSQLSRRDLRVLIIDDLTGKKSYKVGESLLVFGNMFLRTVGGLAEFCRERSFVKDNLWFTYGMEGSEDFHSKTEFALELTLPARWRDRFESRERFEAMAHDVQIVRPEAEEEMLAMLRGFANVTVIETGRVTDVALGAGSEDLHSVTWEDAKSKQRHVVRGRWLLDCSGRNRLLAKRFGHTAETRELTDGFQTTAVWAQFKGVSKDMFTDWQHRFSDGDVMDRHKSTLHLWGKGYWIWVIPLEGGRISVGATFDQRLDIPGKPREQMWHIFRRYPVLERVLTDENVLEFRMFKNVQHWTDTFVHPRRYAMVGDAASIIDAYYSQGMSLGFVTGWHIANIMERDVREKKLDVEYIDRLNSNTRQDWHILRNMVKYKYTDAIADSRFFILTHVLDQLIFTGVLQQRQWLVQWLFETQGYTSRETPWHREIRSKLERTLFYCCGNGLGKILRPEAVRRVQERWQHNICERALARLANGIELPAARALVRFPSHGVPLHRLKDHKRFVDMSPSRFNLAELDRFPMSGVEHKVPWLVALFPAIILSRFLVVYYADKREASSLKRGGGGTSTGVASAGAA